MGCHGDVSGLWQPEAWAPSISQSVCLLDAWRTSPQSADRRIGRIAAWLPLWLPMASAGLITFIRVSFDVSPMTMNPLTLVMVVLVVVVPVTFLDLTARLTAIGWVLAGGGRGVRALPRFLKTDNRQMSGLQTCDV